MTVAQVDGLHDLTEADTEGQRVWYLSSAAVNCFVFIGKKRCFETPAQPESMTL